MAESSTYLPIWRLLWEYRNLRITRQLNLALLLLLSACAGFCISLYYSKLSEKEHQKRFCVAVSLIFSFFCFIFAVETIRNFNLYFFMCCKKHKSRGSFMTRKQEQLKLHKVQNVFQETEKKFDEPLKLVLNSFFKYGPPSLLRRIRSAKTEQKATSVSD